MNILITGGAGFIGSHSARTLALQGHRIVVLDNLTSFVYPPSLKFSRLNALLKDLPITFVSGDIADAKTVHSILKTHAIERVIHLAAHANAGQSVEQADIYKETNTAGTRTLLNVCAIQSIKQFIFASSSTVYSDYHPPFHEDITPLKPNSPYGASKHQSEIDCAAYHQKYKLPVTILRLFSVYGPWGRPDMAPTIFAQHIVAGKPFSITANRSRDYIYIDDVLSAITAALATIKPWGIYNIGSGQATSLADLAHYLAAATGQPLQYTWRQSPAGEMSSTHADITKAKQELAWQPRVTIPQGTKQLMQWLKDYEFFSSSPSLEHI
jgi:UDP-glucuronate 4-epimerase